MSLIFILIAALIHPATQENAPAEFTRAVQLFQNGLYFEAEEMFRATTVKAPKLGQAHFGLAMCLHLTKRHNASFEHFVAAQNCPRPEAQFFSNHGVALEVLSRIDEARTFFNKALELDPGFGNALLNLGKIAGNRGEWGIARKHLEACLKIDVVKKDVIEATYRLATVESRDGELDKAEKLAKEVIRLDPRHTSARHVLFQIARQRGNKVEARQYLRETKRLREEQEKRRTIEIKTGGLLGLGFKMLRQRNIGEAITYFEETLKVDRGNRQARSILGNILEASRKQPGMQSRVKRIEAVLK